MRLMSSVLVAALALAVPAMAQDTTAKKPKATYSKKNTKTVKATVKSIDVATRHVVLTTPDGSVVVRAKTKSFFIRTSPSGVATTT